MVSNQPREKWRERYLLKKSNTDRKGLCVDCEYGHKMTFGTLAHVQLYQCSITDLTIDLDERKYVECCQFQPKTKEVNQNG